MSTRFALATATFARAILPSNGSAETAGGPTTGPRKVHAPTVDEPRRRIEVPLRARLLDAVDAPREADGASEPRRFAVEALDASARSVATLLLREAPAAIGPRTTYDFKRPFDPSRVRYSVLADRSRDRTTIVSIDRSSGRVRGLHREGGRAKRVADEGGRLRVRALEGVEREKEWACGASGRGSEGEDGGFGAAALREDAFGGARAGAGRERGADGRRAGPVATTKGWAQPQKYSFRVDISIEVDAQFIANQGGSAERAVEYVNFLVSAANLVLEHEVDAHLNVVSIEETDRFDNQTNAKEALKMMRMEFTNADKEKGSSKTLRLHHAVLGRYLGGGIAYIDTVCDEDWGFGVTSDLAGSLENVNEDVLFDFFIFIHEVGHSLGSGHTFDAYDPPIDACGPCAVPGSNLTIDGLPRENSGTIMSYCNFCDGGLPNIALTLGGEWNGLDPRNELATWKNNPAIEGDISNEPRRVAHKIWETLSSKGSCVASPVQFNEIQGCSEDDHCDDGNECTIDACEANFCTNPDIVLDCCGNSVCEVGERDNCSDCGPYFIQPPAHCKECFALDGFMIEVGLDEDAERDIFLTSISFMHAAPVNETTVALYSSLEGSYRGKENSNSGWQLLSTNTVSSGTSSEFPEITINPPIRLNVGSESTAFYLFASEQILLFGQGAYSIQNDHGVKLASSRAVAGLFGDGIDGFGLSCSIGYVLNDSLPTSAPTGFPSAHPTKYPLEVSTAKETKGAQAPGRDSLSSQHSSTETETSDGGNEKSDHPMDESLKANSAETLKCLSLVVFIFTCSMLTINKL